MDGRFIGTLRGGCAAARGRLLVIPEGGRVPYRMCEQCDYMFRKS